MYFQEFHLADNIYNAVLGWYQDCFSRSKRTLLIGCRQLSFTLQPYQYDETIFESSLNRNGLFYVIDTGGEIRAVHQSYGLVFMLCIMSAVVRIYAVVNGFGSFHGVQLSTVVSLPATPESSQLSPTLVNAKSIPLNGMIFSPRQSVCLRIGRKRSISFMSILFLQNKHNRSDRLSLQQ